ncbi:DUF6339 family protein [Dokdonella sp. MW10]|uniref:DUF6339 family protein n=1 Tax=Dokdonella sp. MW10 TaxID=2992926 RepID=UPI003F81BC02
MMAKLLYVGQQVADDLSDGIESNVDRYIGGDFLDLEATGDWQIPLSVEGDREQLAQLSPSNAPENEINNSILVGRTLRQLTPTLARENRVWIRLSHVECLEYSRRRWLHADVSSDAMEKQIRKHFFASTLQACRDDHAISRLWWNYYIAAQMLPESPIRALNVMLARADIRQGLIERSGIGMRPALGRAIIHALEQNNSLLRSEALFREFMKSVNLLGAGIAFEMWESQEIDSFTARCLKEATKATLSARMSG